MGILEDYAAQFLDWKTAKRKNIERNVQDPAGLLASFTQDVQQGAAADKSAWDASRSVMPEVRAQGVAEMNQRGQELGAMAPAGLLGWTAWHGSPHKFDKFDLSKIGTGEGAQAYGHGLYFAENPSVAMDYKKRLASKVDQDAYWKNIQLPDSLTKSEWDELATLGQKLRKQHNLPANEMAQWQKLNDKSNAYSDAVKKNEPTGELYKVDISDAKAPQDAFLQWDKPLSEQPKRVQDAMRKLGASPTDTGEQAYLYLQTKAPGIGAQDRYGQPIKRAEDYAGGLMREAGIPGIRYLDGGSRGAGSGTMNTVLFDDSLVKILERNGVPVEQPGLLAREPTKFQLAHAEAQRNAALPVEQGGLGLGPQNTAMERAKAMGFDTPVYHGTKGDKNWNGIDAFDLSMAEPGLTGKGVYTTNSPAIAGGGKGNNVAPHGYATNEALNHVFSKEQELLSEIEQVKKTLAQAKASGDVEKQKLFSDWLAGNEKELADLGQWKTGGGAVYPLTVRAGKSFDPERAKLKRNELPRDVVAKIEDGLLAQGKNPKGKWPLSYSMLDNATGGVDAANDVLRSLGYDSLQYKGGKITGVPVNHQVTMAFDPSRIRSRFAAFDPKKKDSRDLLASMGLLGLLGAGAYGQDNGQ